MPFEKLPYKNSADKELPKLPDSIIDKDKDHLQQENRDLEAAVAVLYKKNLLYLEVINHCIASEEQGLSFQTKANSNTRTIEKRIKQEWNEFCHEIKFCKGSRVQKVIESFKELEEMGEIVIAMS